MDTYSKRQNLGRLFSMMGVLCLILSLALNLTTGVTYALPALQVSTETPTEAPAETATQAPVDTATSAPVDTATLAPVDTATQDPAVTVTLAPADTATEDPAVTPSATYTLTL